MLCPWSAGCLGVLHGEVRGLPGPRCFLAGVGSSELLFRPCVDCPALRFSVLPQLAASLRPCVGPRSSLGRCWEKVPRAPEPLADEDRLFELMEELKMRLPILPTAGSLFRCLRAFGAFESMSASSFWCQLWSPSRA